MEQLESFAEMLHNEINDDEPKNISIEDTSDNSSVSLKKSNTDTVDVKETNKIINNNMVEVVEQADTNSLNTPSTEPTTIGKDNKITETVNSIVEYSLERYSKAIDVDIEYLKFSMYMEETDNKKYVKIPYYNSEGKLLNIKYYSSNEISWEKDEIPNIYGQWMINQFSSDYILVVSSEKQCQKLWKNGICALGICTDQNLKDNEIFLFSKFNKIYIQDDLMEQCRDLPLEKLYKTNSSKLSLDNIQNVIDTFGPYTLNNISEKLSKETINIGPPKQEHVIAAEYLTHKFNLKYYNGKVHMYQNNVYVVATDELLQSMILKFVNINASKKFQKAVIDFIKSWLVSNVPVQVDTDYINCLNGLVYLPELKLIQHTPEIFTVNQVHINFLQEILPCPFAEKYVSDIMSGDENSILAFYQIIGTCLVSKTDNQQFFIFYGEGQNGKSIAAETIQNIVGSENTTHIELQQFEQQFGSHEIDQKLLNVVSDLPFTAIKDVSIFKGIVTGDEFKANVKNKDRITIRPYATHIYSTNKLPRVYDTTEGFYRRVHILLFKNHFEVGGNNFDKSKLSQQEVLDYIGNTGLRDYYILSNSDSFAYANKQESDLLLKDYRNINDTLSGFLNDEEYHTKIMINLIDNTNRIPTTSIWELYKRFCSDNKLKALGQRVFYKTLVEEHGFIKGVSNGSYYFELPLSEKSEESEVIDRK